MSRIWEEILKYIIMGCKKTKLEIIGKKTYTYNIIQYLCPECRGLNEYEENEIYPHRKLVKCKKCYSVLKCE